MTVAIVLNWRSADHTLRAVRALISDGLPAERVVVVDNASNDGSAERFRRELPGIELVALDRNVGFARANNAGARALPADRAYLFVNSDAFLHRAGSIASLEQALEDDAVGIAVPRLRNDDLTLQENVVPLSTPLPELVRASGLSRLVPNGLQPRLGTHWDHSRSRYIQAAIGPVLHVRASLWHDLGGFEERGFMYAEDLDLFWRARRGGWRARFVAEAEFIHLGAASSTKRWTDAERAEVVARAEAQLLRRHLGPFSASVTLGLMAAGVGGRAAVHRILGNHDAASSQLAWLRGYLTPSRRARAPRA